MTDPRTQGLTEEEARDLWHRAAELQANAAMRLEERSRELVPRGEDGSPQTSAYSLQHVRKAAVEAGISEEFVDQALAEVQVGGVARAHEQNGFFTRAFLGDVAHEVEISRVLECTPEEVYAAMQRILPAPPYTLNLIDKQGKDPLNGAVLVFEVPKMTMAGTGSAFAYEMAYGDLKKFFVTLRPLGEDGDRCELTFRSPLGASKKISVGAGVSLTGMLAGVGGLIGAVSSGPLVAAAAVIGIAAAGVPGWRWTYRWGVGRSVKAVEGLLGAIASDVLTGGAFSRRSRWPEDEGKPQLGSGEGLGTF